MGGLSPLIANSRNVDNGLATLYVMSGSIKSVDLVKNMAIVNTSCGRVIDVRIPMPFYSSGGQISASPREGDTVLIAADSQNNYYILGYLIYNPEADQAAFKLKLTDSCMRISNWDSAEIIVSKDIVLNTLNGNMLTINSNTTKPAVSIDTPGRFNLTVAANTSAPKTVVVDTEKDEDNNPTNLLIKINEDISLVVDKDNNISLSAPNNIAISTEGTTDISTKKVITISSESDVEINSSGSVKITANGSILLGAGSSPVVTAQTVKDALTAFALGISASTPLAPAAATTANAGIDAASAMQKTKA